jgi:hypothetical protein
MEFWTKFTTVIMIVLYILILVNGPATESAGMWLASTVLAMAFITAVAYAVKWLYVTAKTPPGGDETTQPPD